MVIRDHRHPFYYIKEISLENLTPTAKKGGNERSNANDIKDFWRECARCYIVLAFHHSPYMGMLNHACVIFFSIAFLFTAADKEEGLLIFF